MHWPISRRGRDVLLALGRFDIGQAAVVIDGHVVGVEDIEGTDGLLARVARLRAEGRIRAATARGVLVKAPKSGQDLRFDLPTMGPRTVEGAAAARLAGIAIVAGHTMVADPAGRDRGGGRRGPFRDRSCLRDAGASNGRRRAKHIPDRDRGIRRSARRQPDEGAAPAPWRRGAVRRRRRPVDDAGGAVVAVSDRGTIDHRARGDRETVAGDPAAHSANRRCGDRRIGRYSRDHRQPRFYPSGGKTRPRPQSRDPDHRLRVSFGLGVAARAGPAR